MKFRQELTTGEPWASVDDLEMEVAMLTTVTLILCVFLVLVMMPLMIWQLLSGSPPSSRTGFRKYELAQPWLSTIGNLFVLALCFIALNRLVEHFGWVGTDLGARIDAWLHYPFMTLFALFVGLWISAIIKVRRSAS